jgi:hypothetical protein
MTRGFKIYKNLKYYIAKAKIKNKRKGLEGELDLKQTNVVGHLRRGRHSVRGR